ncbi:unnamed protein product [Moneuplotes crassus]|uniref:Uncharacterized protein n=1 Tax=Euplotes crassus TaxID=5936 RepID=A0AAD2D690_EUPCR|nr:unnamed protein product [Moneuplotes crassus]
MKESGSEKNLKLHENEPLLPEPRRDLLGGTLNSKLKKGRVKTRKQSYEEPHSDVIYPKILNQKSSKPNKKERLKLEVERKGYLKHIKNLRLAHKVTLKNEKFLTMTKLEEIVSQKLAAYEKGITKILNKFITHFELLNTKINRLNKDVKRYAKFIRKYELNMLETIIIHGGNELEIPQYLYKPQMQILEKDQGFRPMEWLIKDCLKSNMLQIETQDKGIQAHLDNSEEVIQELQKEIALKDGKIKFLQNQLSLSTHELEESYKKREQELIVKYEKYISSLKSDKSQLIHELKNVKTIFKKPYLYNKYFANGFTDFASIEAIQDKMNENSLMHKLREEHSEAEEVKPRVFKLNRKKVKRQKANIFEDILEQAYEPETSTPHKIHDKATVIVRRGKLVAESISNVNANKSRNNHNQGLLPKTQVQTKQNSLMNILHQKHHRIRKRKSKKRESINVDQAHSSFNYYEDDLNHLLPNKVKGKRNMRVFTNSSSPTDSKMTNTKDETTYSTHERMCRTLSKEMDRPMTSKKFREKKLSKLNTNGSEIIIQNNDRCSNDFIIKIGNSPLIKNQIRKKVYSSIKGSKQRSFELSQMKI